jgi:hypothetical protein
MLEPMNMVKTICTSTINPPINDTQKDELVQITRVRNESLQGKKKRKEKKRKHWV